MQNDPVLTKALLLARGKKYDEAIKLLEGEVFRYQDSYQYYHLLGLSCLYAGDFGGAFTYFNKAKNIKMREPSPLLGLAVYFLKRGDTDKAVDLYLEVDDIEPGNAIAARGLSLIKTGDGPEALSQYVESGKAKKLYPPFPKSRFNFKALLLPASVALIVAIAVIGIWFLARREPKSDRAGYAESALTKDELKAPFESGGSYRYLMKDGEAAELYGEARNYFMKYRDEKAKYCLNKIIESNAPASIKNKARVLLSYTAAPGFDTLKDKFNFAEVKAEPYFYRGCYVAWKGSAADVQVGETSGSFNLLVGYYAAHRNLEGTVAVAFNFAADISADAPIEVLGKIVPTGLDNFRLEAEAFHQSPAQ